MGHVYQEFEKDLERWRAQYAGQPRREMLKLLLLALEREQIVSVGYREEAIRTRLNQMPIDEDVREILRHALLWIWKDEEMHAIYIRGALLKMGSLRLRVLAFAKQMAGAVGGWAGSVQQHVPWSQAPLSRALAAFFTAMGALFGKISRPVRRELRYRSFRDFCIFNIDAEKTASLCWRRIIEITARLDRLPTTTVEELRRMQSDEDNHDRIFQILAESFDERDGLIPGETADGLAEKIAGVGEFFLDRARRKQLAADNPLGSGGAVWVVQGATSNEKIAQFRGLIAMSGLASHLRARAHAANKNVGGLRVAIKPSLMLGYHHKDLSTITDPELLRELVRILREQGCRDVALVESRNLYDQFFARRSVKNVAEYFGLLSPEYSVVDLSEEQVPHTYGRGMAQYSVGRTWKEADFRITFGKMRSHPLEHVHLTVANMEAMGSRCDEFLFTERQAHRDAAIMTLISDFPPHFAILDGYERAPDGILGVLGCPHPQKPYRLYAGADAVAVDCVAARHMGMRNRTQSAVLRMAFHWFGNPEARIQVHGPDAPLSGWRGPHHNEWSTFLSFLANPVFIIASGRGTLFVPEMDEQAFPPVRPPGRWLRLGRKMIQALLGLRHGR